MPRFSMFSKKSEPESTPQVSNIEATIDKLIEGKQLLGQYKTAILKEFKKIPEATDKQEIMELICSLLEKRAQLGPKVVNIINILKNHPKLRKDVVEEVTLLLQERSNVVEDNIIDIFMALASITSTRERKAAATAIKLITQEQNAIMASDIKTLIYRYLTINPRNRLKVIDDILQQIDKQPSVTVDDLSKLIDYVQFESSNYFEKKELLKKKSESVATEKPLTEFLVDSLMENQVNKDLYFTDITNKLMEITNGMDRISWINMIGKLITGQKNAGNYILCIIDTLRNVFPDTLDYDKAIYERQNVADNVRVLLQGRFGIEAHIQRLISEVARIDLSERNVAVNTVYFLINGQMIETADICKIINAYKNMDPQTRDDDIREIKNQIKNRSNVKGEELFEMMNRSYKTKNFDNGSEAMETTSAQPTKIIANTMFSAVTEKQDSVYDSVFSFPNEQELALMHRQATVKIYDNTASQIWVDINEDLQLDILNPENEIVSNNSLTKSEEIILEWVAESDLTEDEKSDILNAMNKPDFKQALHTTVQGLGSYAVTGATVLNRVIAYINAHPEIMDLKNTFLRNGILPLSSERSALNPTHPSANIQNVIEHLLTGVSTVELATTVDFKKLIEDNEELTTLFTNADIFKNERLKSFLTRKKSQLETLVEKITQELLTNNPPSLALKIKAVFETPYMQEYLTFDEELFTDLYYERINKLTASPKTLCCSPGCSWF